MNTKKLAMAGFLALSIGSFASAQNIVNVTGSTAFRSLVTSEELVVLGYAFTSTASVPVTASPVYGYDGSSGFGKASYSIVHGYLVDGTETYFRNDWTGSTAGLVDLTSDNANLTWIPIASLSELTTGGTRLDTAGTPYTNTDTAAPNVSMSDAASSDIAAAVNTATIGGTTYGPTIKNAALSDGGTAAGANHTPVAVVTFVPILGELAVGQTAPSGLTTVGLTQQTLKQLITAGYLPLSVWTGQSSDSTNFVIWVGRNEDSGTRIAYMGESQLGVAPAGNLVKQYMLEQSGVSYPTSSTYSSLSTDSSGLVGFKLWPANWSLYSESGINWDLSGHSGYNGGGDVAAVLGSPNPVVASSFTSIANAPSGATSSSKYYFVSMLGTHDATTAIGVGATVLPYNGIALPYTGGSSGTWTFTSVESGAYSAWNLEHLYYLTSGTNSLSSGSEGRAAADELADAIYNTSTSGLGGVGVHIGDVFCSRSITVGSAISGGTLP